jgi:Domain of unknown function (DUF4333)
VPHTLHVYSEFEYHNGAAGVLPLLIGIKMNKLQTARANKLGHVTLGVVLGSCLLLTACGEKSVAKAEVEENISAKLSAKFGQTPKSIVCPSSLPAKVDSKMTCLLTGDDGMKLDVFVTVTSIDGSKAKFNIKVDDKVKA